MTYPSLSVIEELDEVEVIVLDDEVWLLLENWLLLVELSLVVIEELTFELSCDVDELTIIFTSQLANISKAMKVVKNL